ncbi:hypothetical protein Raf01_26600 [Rugosimonospora africana]|uniref:Uncharacterized protein n=1 Tax=Rugosimonospora africana TaxID=556532 RepID=A0A8J3VQM1_9ACTN|nr:hypothetical protein Raf01_26600 [Rugosimonospora africana]
MSAGPVARVHKEDERAGRVRDIRRVSFSSGYRVGRRPEAGQDCGPVTTAGRSRLRAGQDCGDGS